MRLNSVDAIVMGIEDLDAGRQFYRDFGLQQIESGAGYADFETLDGTQVSLRAWADPGLPPAVTDGSTIREVVWGGASKADIDAIAIELSRDRPVRQDGDGRIHSLDDDGYGIAFRVQQRREIEPAPNRLNIYGAKPSRPINSRIDFLEVIRPASVAHVVLFSPDVDRSSRFYTHRLGFRVSDRFRNGKGAFLRSSGSSYHHNLFLIEGPSRGLHHVAFPVVDFNDVVLGGRKMLGQGWTSKMGPGRHKIGSNFFWYFNSPAGGAMELTADMDRLDDNWVAEDWDFTPENAAAWSMTFNSTLVRK